MNISPCKIHIRCKIMLLKETLTETPEFAPSNSDINMQDQMDLPRSTIQPAPLLSREPQPGSAGLLACENTGYLEAPAKCFIKQDSYLHFLESRQP